MQKIEYKIDQFWAIQLQEVDLQPGNRLSEQELLFWPGVRPAIYYFGFIIVSSVRLTVSKCFQFFQINRKTR